MANVYLLICKKCLCKKFNMSVKLEKSFALDETVTKIILETMTVISHAYGGLYMSITQVLVTVDF